METNESNVYVGIDIQKEHSQICYYDENTKNIIQIQNGESEIFENLVNFDEVLNDSEKAEERLFFLVSHLVKKTDEKLKTEGVSIKYCFCIFSYSFNFRNLLHKVLLKLGIDKKDYMIIGEEEAFAYYTYSGEQSLVSPGTILYNYTKSSVKSSYLSRINYKNKTLLHEMSDELKDDSLKEAIEKNLHLDNVTDVLNEFFTKTLSKNKVASVYLTGVGFDKKDLPKQIISKLSVSGCRIFVGQNLFVKGATLSCLSRYVKMADPFKKAGIYRNVSVLNAANVGGKYSTCLVTIKNRLLSDIYINTYSNNEIVKQKIAKVGENIDSSLVEFECLLTTDIFQLEIQKLLSDTVFIDIDLKEFDIVLKKERLNIKIEFETYDIMHIRVASKEKLLVSKKIVISNATNKEEKIKPVIYCVGKYAKTPFIFDAASINIHSLEQLAISIYENVYLVDDKLLNEKLVIFIKEKLEEDAIADGLKILIEKETPINQQILYLLNKINYYDKEKIESFEKEYLSEEVGLLSKKYMLATSYLKNNRIMKAFNILTHLENNQSESDETLLYKIKYNIGICYARMYEYEKAAAYFEDVINILDENDENKLKTVRKTALITRVLSNTKPNIPHTAKEIEEVKSFISLVKSETKEEINDYQNLLKEKKKEYVIAFG